MTPEVALREVSQLRILMPTDADRSIALNWIPVSSSEYHLASRYFPFALRIDNRRPQLGLLMHPRYLIQPPLDGAGQWRGFYRPIGSRCFPFKADDISDDPLSDIRIAADSNYLSPTDGTPVLDEAGRPASLITELHRLLSLLRRSRDIFSDVLDQYLIAGLLRPLNTDADDDAATPFYVIDRSRLGDMSHTALGAMARHRFLGVDLAVTWAFSLNNLQTNWLPKDPGRSHLGPLAASLRPAIASGFVPTDDLPLVLDDGELVPLPRLGPNLPEPAGQATLA